MGDFVDCFGVVVGDTVVAGDEAAEFAVAAVSRVAAAEFAVAAASRVAAAVFAEGLVVAS